MLENLHNGFVWLVCLRDTSKDEDGEKIKQFYWQVDELGDGYLDILKLYLKF